MRIQAILLAVGRSLAGASLPLADGCARVYIDCGTNLGVHVRKLFEPERYPGAKVLPLFDHYFGAHRQRDGDLCAFGFEANPLLAPRLRAIERAYRDQGWRVTMFTEAAVGVSDGEVNMSFPTHLWLPAPSQNALGLGDGTAGEAQPEKGPSVNELLLAHVRTVDLSRFLSDHVHVRRVPPRGGWQHLPAAVVIRLNAEEADAGVLEALVKSEVLCGVDAVYMEPHPHVSHDGDARERYQLKMAALRREVQRLRTRPGCRPDVIALRDNSYFLDDGHFRVDMGDDFSGAAHGRLKAPTAPVMPSAALRLPAPPAHAQPNQTMAAAVEARFRELCSAPSDINEHLPTLRALAAQVDAVVEMGVRGVVSTWALLSGLGDAAARGHGAHQKWLLGVDVQACDYREPMLAGRGLGVEVSFVQGNSVTVDVPPRDLLFIDTWHVYGHLRRELARHHASTNWLMVLHDTTVDAVEGESLRQHMDVGKQVRESGYAQEEIERGIWPAVEEFLAAHPEWEVHEHRTNNNGLTVLCRRGWASWQPAPAVSPDVSQGVRDSQARSLGGDGLQSGSRPRSKHSLKAPVRSHNRASQPTMRPPLNWTSRVRKIRLRGAMSRTGSATHRPRV